MLLVRLTTLPLVNVICWNVVVVLVPVSTMTTRLPLLAPVFRPSNVQLPEAVPKAHVNVTALVMHSEVGAVSPLPVHDAPV